MSLSSTLSLFFFLLPIVHASSQLLPNDRTTKWPRKAELAAEAGNALTIKRDRLQRSADSAFSDNSECQEGIPLGASYSGRVNVTSSGRTCQAWSTTQPHDHPFTELGDHNYCRNPSGDLIGVWCFTTDPDVSWEYCHSVPVCRKLITVLDFSTDNDQKFDSNGEFTGASLEAGPLPESFTICTAFMVEAWTSGFLQESLFTLLTDHGYPWAFITLGVRRSDATYTQYEVWVGPFHFLEKIEAIFFPLQWTRVCLSVDSMASKMTLVVDGQLLGEEEYKREEEFQRPANVHLIVGFYPAFFTFENTGSVSGLNIFSSSLPLERMKKLTVAGQECGAPGDHSRKKRRKSHRQKIPPQK